MLTSLLTDLSVLRVSACEVHSPAAKLDALLDTHWGENSVYVEVNSILFQRYSYEGNARPAKRRRRQNCPRCGDG